MTLPSDLSEATSGRQARWLVVLTAFGTLPALGLSVMVVVALALTDQEPVSNRAAKKSVDLGRPLAWLHQDQRGLDPPLPARLGVHSPWESPTSVSGTAFLLDVLVVFTAVAVVGMLASTVVVALSRQVRSASKG